MSSISRWRQRIAAVSLPAGLTWTTVLYVAAVFLYWFSLYLYVPTLPTYAKSKSSDLEAVGLVLSMYGLWQAVVRLPLGIASDWLGRRKPFIVGGFVLTALGAWVMGAAGGLSGPTGIAMIGVGRAITGLAAATWVPLIVVFSGLFPPQEAVRASSLLTLIGSTARVLATVLNGPLNDWSGSYALAFYLAAGAAGLSLLLIWPGRESPRPAQPPSFKSMGVLVARRDVLLPSILSAVNQYAVWGTTFGFIPVLADQLGAADVIKSLLVSLNLGVGILGNLTATTMIKWIGSRRLVQGSILLMSLGMGTAALASNLPLLFVAQLLIGLGGGVVYPVLMGMSIEHVQDAERTTAMGLHQAIYAIGMFAGPWLSGILAEAMGLSGMFGLTAVVSLGLGLLLCRFLARPVQNRS